MLYPSDHPYSWPVIGSMTDLSAASLEDVKEFFRTWYAPNNAVIVVAGDVKADEVKRLVRQYFGEIPRGPAIERPTASAFSLARDTIGVLEDRVQLARLNYAWPTVPLNHADDAALDVAAYLLTGARNSRITQKLVYQQELASNVNAFQASHRLSGDFRVIATARPGIALPPLQQVIDQELRTLAADGPTARELEQAKNSIESSFLGSLERVGGKADQLNAYYYQTGNPDGFQTDLDRYRGVTAADVQRVVEKYLLAPKVILSVVPLGKPDLAAEPTGVTP